jgi:glutamate--cysteine ligase
VSDHDPRLDAPIRSDADLYAIFHEAEKPKERWLIGAEMEKFGVLERTGEPLRYEGDHGVLRVMHDLERPAGWAPVRERAGGPIIALTRGGESITLEPGSQFELSGAPLGTIHEICAEFHRHMAELTPISKNLGIRWMGLGFHPFAKRSDLSFVPKGRYGIMREYLPTRGAHALDMMLRTCTVQANFDYANERDALRKMRIGLKLSPLTTAMFANSPWYEGVAHGGLTYRGSVWLDVDPDRSGLLPALWDDGAGYTEYVEWALDTPMFLFKRGEKVIANTGQTFRTFWKEGYGGYKAVMGDWPLHLNTLFPEVRLKSTIEIRGADAQGKATRCALPALWTGLYYDDRALDGVEELTADWRHGEVAAVRADVAKRGVRAVFRGRPMVDLALRVLELAEGGLARRARTREDGKDERIHLGRLRQLLEKGLTPADKLLEGMDQVKDFRSEVMARADLAGS